MASFLFATTAVAAIVGTSLIFPNPLLDRLWGLNRPAFPLFHALDRTAGVLLLALGVGTAAAARGLLSRKVWAWWFAVVLFAINGAGDVVSLVATGDLFRTVVGVTVAAAFLYLLTRPHVRRYFTRIRIGSQLL